MQGNTILVKLADSLPMALLILGVLLLLLLIWVLVLLRRSRRSVPEGPGGAEASGKGDAAAPLPAAMGVDRYPRLALSFRRALRRLRRHLPGTGWRYRAPWVVVTGPPDSRPRELLGESGLGLPFGPPVEGDKLQAPGLRWWFFDRGLVMDVEAEPASSLEGAQAQDSTWKAVLKLLLQHRPKRPLDGLVLTLSCQDLLAARQDAALHRKLEKSAEAFYEKLWEAQRRLGFRFPVYVLVTGCEVANGFSAFSRRLPERLRPECFGWSNGYSLDTAYRGEWVEEAFGTIGERLREVQAELLTSGTIAEDGDDVFLFPAELLSLQRPLRGYLDALFKPSTYHESVLLRGLYFCGETETLDLADGFGAVETASGAGTTSFLRDLFELKIFPEAKLASPTRGTLAALTRKVRFAQVGLAILAITLGLGMWHSYDRLGSGREVLYSFLDELSRDLLERRLSRQRAEVPDRARAAERAANLFEGLTELEVSRFNSYFYPASWIDHVDAELREVMKVAFEEGIFDAMRLDLEVRVDDLLSARSFAYEPEVNSGVAFFASMTGTKASNYQAVAVEKMEEFQALRTFVVELSELGKMTGTYNDLGQRNVGDLHRLADLTRFTFEYELPEGFFENSGLYSGALAEAEHQAFRSDQYQEQAIERFRELTRALDERIFQRSSLVTLLTDLQELMRRIRSGFLLNEGGSGAIRSLLSLLQEVENLLPQEEIQWAFDNRFDFGPEYQALMASARLSPFLSGEAVDTALRESEIQWIGYRNALPTFLSPLTGPLLAVDDQGRSLPRLSADLEVIKTALVGFQGESFMVQETSGHDLRTRIPAGTALRWDINFLERAVDLHEPYIRFRDQGLQYFPDELRGPLDLVARRRLERRLMDLIARAQIFVSAPTGGSPQLLVRQIRGEIELYEVASPAINRLIAVFEELQLWEPAQSLAGLHISQGFQFLSKVDLLLDSKELYLPRGKGFSWWDGEGDVALQGFAVSDPVELVSYLDRQRERIAHLARNLAQPVVASLSAGSTQKDPIYQERFSRWQEILEQLSAYDDQKPDNSVAALESFILQELPKLSLASCVNLEAIPLRTGIQPDFFEHRRRQLRRGLQSHCQGLVAERALRAYSQLADLFNQRLAGRFPFAEPSSSSFEAEAEPEALRRFFALFDAEAPLILSLPPEHPSFGGDGPALFEFLQQAGEVRTFLASFLDTPEGELEPPEIPAFDLFVEFRVNREQEQGAHRIIHWSLDLGDQRLTHRDEEPRGRWVLGEPVRLSLQWASDSPVVPLPVAQWQEPTAGVWVDARTAVFERANSWSLLDLVASHPGARQDFEGFEDPKPHTLKFTLETTDTARLEIGEKEDPSQEESLTYLLTPPVVEQATVFVRLQIAAPDSKEPLVVPTFPHSAPIPTTATEQAWQMEKPPSDWAPPAREAQRIVARAEAALGMEARADRARGAYGR